MKYAWISSTTLRSCGSGCRQWDRELLAPHRCRKEGRKKGKERGEKGYGGQTPTPPPACTRAPYRLSGDQVEGSALAPKPPAAANAVEVRLKRRRAQIPLHRHIKVDDQRHLRIGERERPIA